MNNSIVRLVWNHASPKETDLHLAVDKDTMLHIVLERTTMSCLEDAMICYIEGTQKRSEHSIFPVIVDTIHASLGDKGVDAVLSGMAIITQKMDNDAQGEIPCESVYTYSCDSNGEVKISHE